MFARISERMENIKDGKEDTKEKVYFYFSNCYNLFAGDFSACTGCRKQNFCKGKRK